MNIPLRNTGLFHEAELNAGLTVASPGFGDAAFPDSITINNIMQWLGHVPSAGACLRIGPAPLGRWWIAVQDDKWRLFTLRGFMGPREYVEIHFPKLKQRCGRQAAAIFQSLFSVEALAENGPLEKLYQRHAAPADCRPLEQAARALEQQDRAGRHSQHGCVSTPADVVEYMVFHTVGQLPNTALSRVIDPAVGWGAFLIGTANLMLARQLEKSQPNPFHHIAETSRKILTGQLYGYDKNPEAVRLTRALLLHKFGGGNTVRKALRKHVLVADSLAVQHPAEAPWDVVIGNPPWVSYGLRGTAKLTANDRHSLQKQFPDSAEYKISLYALFMEQAMRWTAAGGRHAFIVPDSFLAGRYFSKIRQHLLTAVSLESLDIINGRLWNKVAVGRSVIYVARKQPEQKSRILVRWVDAPNKLHAKGGYRISAKKWHKRPRSRFLVCPRRCDFDLVHRIERNTLPLENMLEFYSGLIGRQGQSSIILSPDSEAGKTPSAPLIESGRRLQRYALEDAGWRVRLNPALIKSGYAPDRYRNPKIFLNQTGGDLKACVDRQGFYCLNNLHIGSLRDERCSLDFLAGILNSRLMAWYYAMVSMEEGRALAQTDIDMLHQLPIPAVQKQHAYDRITQMARVPLGKRTQELEREHNARVFELYGLNRLDICIIEDWTDQKARIKSVATR